MRSMIFNITKASTAVAILLICINAARSQQDPMFTQYMFNQVTVNPGYAGSAEVANVMVLSRRQWVGFDGAPKTFNLAANAPFPKASCGAGFSLITDKIGPIQQTGVFVDYAYHLKVNEKSKLGMGIKAGFNYFKANLQDIKTIDANDAAFARNVDGDIKSNFGIGFFYYTHTFYAGFSIPKLLKNDLSPDNSVNNNEVQSTSERHYYFIAGNIFDLNESLKFRPSILAKLNKGAPLQIDLTANFIIHEKFWLGAMYRIGNAFGAMVQVQLIKWLRVGYAYDLTTTYLKRYNSGTHEIMVSFDFFTGKNKIRSPRYF